MGTGISACIEDIPTTPVSGTPSSRTWKIASVNEEFLRSIRRLIGTACWKTRNRGFKSHRPLFHLIVTSSTIRWMLPLLVPYLRLKREQALCVLEHLTLVKKGRHGHHPRSEELYKRMKSLNRRGRDL